MISLEKKDRVRSILRGSAPLLVAYSGGVDSACLLALAHRELGDKTLGVIADSPSLPRSALHAALETAKAIGARVEVVKTNEFSNGEYLKNAPDRCYFCKAELFSRMESIARDRGFAHIAYGENADDPADLRPGSRAAAEFRVLAPLKEAGLTKADVREIAKSLGLSVHDAPAQPCLSSRIPHGTRVTPQALALVERAEDAVRALGFSIFRVRFIDESPPAARLQIDPEEMPRLSGLADDIEKSIRSAGFARVEIDPVGYNPPKANSATT